jgi:hypothetical protein
MGEGGRALVCKTHLPDKLESVRHSAATYGVNLQQKGSGVTSLGALRLSRACPPG